MKDLLSQYEIVTVDGIQCNIGLGAYGSVQLAKCLKTQQKVAIKKIWNKLGVTQVKFHQTLQHNNIIKLIDYFYDDKISTTYIVLEYAENGCLYDFIKRNGISDRNVVRRLFKSVCQALDYMHKKGIMHRDIKPQNILLGKHNEVKLCDFGFATYCQPRKTICGTPEYMAPEMIIGKHYNHKIDVWGLGILLFELIQGHAPFEGTIKQQILKEMKKPIYFSEKFFEEEIELIQRILRVDSKERPQINEIMQHRWFGGKHINNKDHMQDSLYIKSTLEDETIYNTKGIKILKVRQIGSSEYPQLENVSKQCQISRDCQISRQLNISKCYSRSKLNISSQWQKNKQVNILKQHYLPKHLFTSKKLDISKTFYTKDEQTMELPQISLMKMKSQHSYLTGDKTFYASFKNGKISLKKKPVDPSIYLSYFN